MVPSLSLGLKDFKDCISCKCFQPIWFFIILSFFIYKTNFFQIEDNAETSLAGQNQLAKIEDIRMSPTSDDDADADVTSERLCEAETDSPSLKRDKRGKKCFWHF